MAALEAAGLVKGEDTEVDIMGIMGKPRCQGQDQAPTP
jgi:hypothetical protein